MRPADPRTGKLLRWYPRAWRERYGGEMLALIQDTLDGRRPTWRLRAGLAKAGLRERAYQAARTVAAHGPAVNRWVQSAWVASIVAVTPFAIQVPVPPARGWQVTAVFDALLAIGVFTAAAALAAVLVAIPASARFLRAGGWPKVRRRISWAAGATVPAAGGLAGIALSLPAHPTVDMNVSLASLLVLIATALAGTVALGLWASAFSALGRDVKFAPRVRAAEVALRTVISVAGPVTLWTYFIWYNTARSAVPWLVMAVGGLAFSLGVSAPPRIRLAVRRSRRILAAAGRGR
jgi:hypothetical protein